MAKLLVQQSIVNDNYMFVFSIDLSTISDDDMARVKKFGAPSINFGGTFTDSESITYSFPDAFFNFPADFPITQTFSITVAPFNVEDPTAYLALYRTTMVTRISSAITTLRGLSDTFTGEFIANI